jgi:uncharacterized protein YceK
VVGDRYFSGVRDDYVVVFERSRIGAEQRQQISPVLGVVDMPFSFVGDILFLPYDVYQDCGLSSHTNTVTPASHE